MLYSSIHDAARMVGQLGAGSEMAKIDMASAFYFIPVHPDEHHLLGMKWQNQVFVDQQLQLLVICSYPLQWPKLQRTSL